MTPGTLLDGELVVLRQGKPDLSLVQSRHQLRSPHKIHIRAQTTPATYIVFDQRELDQFVGAFAEGLLNLLLIIGRPGVQKSQTVKQAVGERACWIDGSGV